MKHRKPKKQPMTKTVKILLVILCAAIVLNLAIVVAIMNLPESDGAEQNTQATENQLQAQQNTDPEQTSESTEATTPVQPAPVVLEMPYTLEDGKLMVEAIFELDGLNPDCDNAEAVGVVGIQLKNTSQEHLCSLELYLTAPDGTVVKFVAADIPSGKTVMVFSQENLSMEGEPACTKIECSAVFEAESPLMTEQVVISVDGTEITVKNVSGEDLTQITVHCHSVLADSYYGGITYHYIIDSLPAGESATVTAWDCILGMTDVVRIDIGT